MGAETSRPLLVAGERDSFQESVIKGPSHGNSSDHPHRMDEEVETIVEPRNHPAMDDPIYLGTNNEEDDGRSLFSCFLIEPPMFLLRRNESRHRFFVEPPKSRSPCHRQQRQRPAILTASSCEDYDENDCDEGSDLVSPDPNLGQKGSLNLNLLATGAGTGTQAAPAASCADLASKASETFASTVSLDSQSLRSVEGGFLSLTSSSHQSSSHTEKKKKKKKRERTRMVDVYQTDSTMLWNEQGEEWSPLVFLSNQSRLQLPFRRCSRHWCTCRNAPTCNSNKDTNTSCNQRASAPSPVSAAEEEPSSQPASPTNNSRRFLRETTTPLRASAQHNHNHHHHRQVSDDLQGLWIPVEEVASNLLEDADDEADADTTSPTRELRWTFKSYSERNLFSSTQAGEPDNEKNTASVDSLAVPAAPPLPALATGQRTRAFSEDLALQQQPRISPPSPERRGSPRKKSLSSDGEIEKDQAVSSIQMASPLIESSSSAASGNSCNPADADAPSAPNPLPAQCRRRVDSQDHFTQKVNVSSPASNGNTNKTATDNRRAYHRLRSRSEDVIDMRPGEAASGAPRPRFGSKELQRSTSLRRVVPEALHRRQRARSEDVVDQRSSRGTPVIIGQSDDSVRGSSSSNRSRANPAPTKLKHYRQFSAPLLDDNNCERPSTAGGNTSKLTPRSPTSVLSLHDVTASTASESAPAMPSQPTHLSPASLHYQSKLASLRCLIDKLRRQRTTSKDSTIPIIRVYHEMAWLHFQNARYGGALCVVNHALERLYLIQEKNSCGGCLTLVETLAKIKDDGMKPLLAQLLLTKARIVLSSEQATSGMEESVIQNDGTELYQQEAKYFAKAAVALVEPLLHQQQPHHRPDLMAIVANGLSLLGRTYDGFSKPGLAMDHFQQSLNMFRYLAHQQQTGSTSYETWIAETALHVGNLHMEQGMLDLAKDSYWEALRLYRSVYQEQTSVVVDMAMTLTNLGWLHLQENDLSLAHHSTVEALWLLQYYHGDDATQSVSRSLRNLASVEYQLGMIASRAGHSRQALSFWKAALDHQQLVFCCDHPDIAITMEAIGSTYQQLGQWEKARNFLEGAIGVRKGALTAGLKTPVSNDALDVARIQSRLSLVLLELKEYDRAKRTLARSVKRYKLGSVPLDVLGQRAKRLLSRVRYEEQDRLNG